MHFDDSKRVVYSNEHLSDIMRIAIPVTAASAALVIATNGDYREYFASRWAKFTSPQHVSPDQAVDFHFRSWEDMKNQYTHCDRGVHLVYSYIPVIPAATILDKTYSILVNGQYNPGLSNWSVIGASLIVTGFGLLEEYLDGHQRNEGFDVIDLTANITGTCTALLKYYGFLPGVDLYWSYNRELIEEYNSPWWTYMSAYEFAVNIDVITMLTKRDRDNTIYNLMINTPGYIPDLRKIANPQYR
ncbi:MAG: hypothetical protein R6U31_07265 [bacterium]